MAYDDRPLYEINKSNVIAISAKKENEIGKYRGQRDAIPSDIYLWWQRENPLKMAGDINEIDINDIKAAYGNVKNEWKNFVMENKDFIESFLFAIKINNKETLNEMWKEIQLKKSVVTE